MMSFSAADIDASAVIAGDLYRIGSNPTLVAIPLFTFCRDTCSRRAMHRQRLVNLARALFGWIPGGLGDRGAGDVRGLHRIHRRHPA
ncbi:MAG: hypothetical protein MZV64_49050 [Ignavibacteriales bacterium]|nr:hypothetical protein [Ignavibacteriales bacterium]